MHQGSFGRAPLPSHWHSIDTLNSGLVAPQAAPVSAAHNVGIAYYVPLMVRDAVMVKKLWVACGASGTNMDVGLYALDGTRLVSSGTQTHPAAATEFVYDCTDTAIGPGIFYIAIMALDGAGAFYAFTTTMVAPPAGVCYQTSLSALPASASFTLAGGPTYVPVGGILTNTVVS